MSLVAMTIWENRPKKFEKRQEWGASFVGRFRWVPHPQAADRVSAFSIVGRIATSSSEISM